MRGSSVLVMKAMVLDLVEEVQGEMLPFTTLAPKAYPANRNTQLYTESSYIYTHTQNPDTHTHKHTQKRLHTENGILSE